jgi:acyl dehydratase
VGDRITCRGVVVEKFEADGEQRVRLELSTVDAHGQVKLSGDAVIALS